MTWFLPAAASDFAHFTVLLTEGALLFGLLAWLDERTRWTHWFIARIVVMLTWKWRYGRPSYDPPAALGTAVDRKKKIESGEGQSCEYSLINDR